MSWVKVLFSSAIFVVLFYINHHMVSLNRRMLYDLNNKFGDIVTHWTSYAMVVTENIAPLISGVFFGYVIGKIEAKSLSAFLIVGIFGVWLFNKALGLTVGTFAFNLYSIIDILMNYIVLTIVAVGFGAFIKSNIVKIA